MKNKLVAIVTPTYNRAYIINKLYDSLLAQTSFNFAWYIVDDGSTDNLKEVVDKFDNSKFDIHYIYKTNGGKHTAINTAMEVVTECLTFIVDSDDYLTEDAIAIIEKDYADIKDKQDVCGLSYLKAFPNNKLTGKPYTKDRFEDTYINERVNNSGDGDKAEVYKTEVLKKFPFPVFAGERFVSEAVVWCPIGRKYKLLFINKIIYYCDYLIDGLSYNVKKLIYNNPYGATKCYLELSTKPVSLTKRIKYTLAYMSYGNVANITKKEQYKTTPNKLLYIILFIPAQILTCVLRRKYGKK